jgi:anti-anti-sigma factor
MTTAIYNTTAEPEIAPNPPANPIHLTELVWGADRRLLERLEPLTRRQSVTLDLSSVQRIDAAGISALVALYTAAQEAGHMLRLSNVSARVAEVLSVVGLDCLLLNSDAVRNSFSGPHFLRPAA